MAEQKESSVLFSLKELMSLEEDRIKQEDDDKKRKEAAELHARQEAERRAREAEEARMQGEVEKARHEAENQARLRAMSQQQEHERQLAALSQDKKKKQLTYIAVGIGALLILGGAGGGFAFYKSGQEQARVTALKNAEIAEKQAQLDKLMGDLKAQSDAIATAQAEAASAKSDADREAAKAKLAAAQAEQKKIQGSIAAVQSRPAGHSGGGSKTPKPACTCQAGDPLCSCL